MDPRHAPLFAPITFGCGLAIENRIAIAPMTTWSSHADGTVHQDELAYLERRARGPGMVITAACYVQRSGHAFPGQWACHDDSTIDSLRAAALVIQAHGAKAILQIHHGGRLCPLSVLGFQAVSASAVAAQALPSEPPRAMSDEEIRATVAAFAAATGRAIDAGYDGVEVHGANNYLLQQFFSPQTNRRNDAWGGSLERRMRFPLAVLDAVQHAAAGADRPFAVGYRLSPEETDTPGITAEDTLLLVDEIVARRPDWIHISTRDYRRGSIRDRSDGRRPTTRILEQVAGTLPVIGVGHVQSPEDAMAVLEDGCAVVAMGRMLLTEPEWVKKVLCGDDRLNRSLPTAGGDALLTLPTPMYNRLLSVPGWIPVDEQYFGIKDIDRYQRRGEKRGEDGARKS